MALYVIIGLTTLVYSHLWVQSPFIIHRSFAHRLHLNYPTLDVIPPEKFPIKDNSGFLTLSTMHLSTPRQEGGLFETSFLFLQNKHITVSSGFTFAYSYDIYSALEALLHK